MGKILLVRHGHVEGIAPERFRGREDVPLTERGRAQATAASQFIASRWRPSRVYMSPLQRCVVTAETIAEACKTNVSERTELVDIDYGSWQFRSYEDAKADDPALFAQWFAAPHLVRFPGGESLQDLAARAADIVRFALSEHENDIIVVVSHDSFNRVLLTQLLGLPLSSYWCLAQDPCCVNELDVTGKSVRLVRMNETCHLSDRICAATVSTS